MSNILDLYPSTLGPEDFKSQLVAKLNTFDSWKGSITSQTGTAIINMISAVGALNQSKIVRARQEAYPDTLLSDEAAYAAADFQGVRISRKVPASFNAELSYSTPNTSASVPAYSQFKCNGNYFFNRENFIIPASGKITITLYQGQVKRLQSTGIGEDYSSFIVPYNEAAFRVSDSDVRVTINGTQLRRVTDGLWNYRNQKAFQDRTLPDGRLLIQFGTSVFGYKPVNSDTIIFLYIVTKGSDGNDVQTKTNTVSTDLDPGITGTGLTNPSGGFDQKPALSYKNVAAQNFGNFGSAVTRVQHMQAALDYQGVVDAVTFSQREVNPMAKEWMNLIRVVPLTSTVWSKSQIDTYLSYLESKSYGSVFFYEAPKSYQVNVKTTVFCYPWADPSTVKKSVSDALIKLFAARQGIIQFDFFKSDIGEAIKNSSTSISHYVLESPTSDIVLSNHPVPQPTLVVDSTQGSLLKGDYMYGIVAVTNFGKITVRNWSSASVLSDNSSIQISWESIPGAISYEVYGRTAQKRGLLAVVPISSSRTFIDYGSVTPGVDAPAQNSVPIQYAQLGSADISVIVTNRTSRESL